MQGAAVSQALKSHHDHSIEGDKFAEQRATELFKLQSVRNLLAEEEDGFGGKQLVVKTSAAPGLSAETAGTFDLNRDGRIDETEVELIKASAHLTNPTQVVEQAKQVVEDHVKRKADYKSLLLFFSYFILYVTILLLQNDASSMYKMQKSIQNAFLPTSTEYINKNQFLFWLQQSVLSNSFVDPVCGNGLCEGPVEFPAFGDSSKPAHGCLADCGMYPNTSKIEIRLTSHFDPTNQLELSKSDVLSWNLVRNLPTFITVF
jgi:hypothetical protein